MHTAGVITILFVREGVHWLAQSLEHDVVAYGPSINAAMESWAEVFAAQIFLDLKAGREPLEGIAPAPERYFAMRRDAKQLVPEPIRLPDGVPEAWMLAAMRPDLRVAC